MKANTSIKVKEIGTENHYMVYLTKATVDNPNAIGFDHRFKKCELLRLSKIGHDLGLNISVQNSQIEFQDDTRIEFLNGIDFFTDVPETNFEKFCRLIQTRFEVVD